MCLTIPVDAEKPHPWYGFSVRRDAFRNTDKPPSKGYGCHGTTINVLALKDVILVGGDGREVYSGSHEVATETSTKVYIIGRDLVCATAGNSNLCCKFVKYLKARVSEYESRGGRRPTVEACANMFTTFLKKGFDITKKGKTIWNLKDKLRDCGASFIFAGFEENPDGGDSVPHLWVVNELGAWRVFGSYSMGCGAMYSNMILSDDCTSLKPEEGREKVKEALLTAAENSFYTGGDITIATIERVDQSNLCPANKTLGKVKLEVTSVKKLMETYGEEFDEYSWIDIGMSNTRTLIRKIDDPKRFYQYWCRR